jgi:hypothetical protein
MVPKTLKPDRFPKPVRFFWMRVLVGEACQVLTENGRLLAKPVRYWLDKTESSIKESVVSL